MAKLENKVHELEAELAGTQARTGESAKAYQRAERKCKELAFTSGEDKKNQDRMTDLTSKQQIEEAEEIAALNLAKFRKAQQELEEVEVRLTNYRNCTIVAFVGTLELAGKITNLQKITHYEISPKLLFHFTKSVRHCGDKDFLTRSLDLTKSC